MKTLIKILLLLLAAPLQAATYYVDVVNGSDANTSTQAQSKSTPWAHAPGMPCATSNAAAYSPVPNDQIIFKGGTAETWGNSCYPWSPAGGSSGNPTYYGVDKTWFQGGSWTRPVFNPGSAVISSSSTNTMFNVGPNTTLDNFEVTGYFTSTAKGTACAGTALSQCAIFDMNQQSGQTVTNMYVHGWTHDGTDHTNTCCIIAVFFLGGLPGNNNQIFSNNVIDGSDVATDHSVNAFFNGPTNADHNFIRQVSSAFIVSYPTSIHDNYITDIGPAYCNKPFPANAGNCTHENAFEDNADLGLSFYNNVITNVQAGLALWIAPNPTFTANVFNNVIYNVQDNQVVDIAPPVYDASHCSSGATTNNYCTTSGTYIFENNTIQCGDDATQYSVCTDNVGLIGSGSTQTVITNLVEKNNHFIGTSTSPGCATSSGHPVSCTFSSNTIQSQATANGQGYNSSQAYAFSPTSGGSTIGAGVNLTSGWPIGSTNDTTYGCTDVSGVSTCPARVTNTRPASTAWDTGAYEFVPTATTWYIRHDGGTNAQCSGTVNHALAGATGNNCAYNHQYQMMDFNGHWAALKSGDTIIYADPPTNTTPYLMGEQNGGIGTDWSTQLGGICPHPNPGHAAGAGCILPPFPDNVTMHGQNSGSCHTSGHTGLVHPTVLDGIAGAFNILNFQGTNGDSVDCFEISQPDNCTNAGIGSGGGCGDLANYVQSAGIMFAFGTAQGPRNLTMRDMAVDGTAGYGIQGSHIGTISSDVLTASDIYLIGNGGAGWNSDGGGCIANCESIGTMNISNMSVQGNGCLLLKPFDVSMDLVHNQFSYCFGQSTGGYGDGFVLIAAGAFTVNIDHSNFKYNTQDGFDGFHIADDNTTSPITNISTSWSEGNGGAAIKVGVGAGVTDNVYNNVGIGNCHILNNSSFFTNNPPGWIVLDEADTCRASGDQWSLILQNGSTLHLADNSMAGYGTTMLDLGCGDLDPACGSNGATVTETNDTHIGYPDPQNAGRLASGWFLEPGILTTTVTATHNSWFNMNTGCPDNTLTGETNYVCGDPLWVAESNVDALNPNLTGSSPLIGAGVLVSGITTDFNGKTRPNPPSIGAFEPGSAPPVNPTPSFSGGASFNSGSIQ